MDTENPDFKEDIREGIRQKLREDKKLLKMLCKTEGKPLKHYYVYESKKNLMRMDYLNTLYEMQDILG